LRIAVGQNSLAKENVPSALRGHPPDHLFQLIPGGFNFWRDLRPPFSVISVRRLEGPAKDGERYAVTYECDVDYHTEYCSTAENTYDVKIHGEAELIIPDNYPVTRSLQILDWGTPKMNWTPTKDEMANIEDHRAPWTIWQPLANELKERPTARRFQTISVPDNLKRGTMAKTEDVSIDPVAKALLGRHDFNKLHKTIHSVPGKGKERPSSQGSGAGDKPRRRFIVFTASAGFVPYEG